jgi:hypothetical protein
MRRVLLLSALLVSACAATPAATAPTPSGSYRQGSRRIALRRHARFTGALRRGALALGLAVAALAGLTPAACGRPLDDAPACDRPAPASATGYAALWRTLPIDQWGGGDVSISVPLGDGRIVWLYGDTMSTGRMVHSSAIVQDGGCLHVSHRGAQVLPNDSARVIYWISAAQAVGRSSVDITARRITLSPERGVWGFADAGHSVTWRALVTAAGDLDLVSRGAAVESPAPDPGPFYTVPGDGFGYARHAHPWAVLASGETLTTTCRNYDDSRLRDPRAYAPVWSEM